MGRARARAVFNSLIDTGRPFRAKDAVKHGVAPFWLGFMCLPHIVRLERGVYGCGQTKFPRIATVLVRVNNSFACLYSALWMHGLIEEEPPQAWICIQHKAWKPTPMPTTPTRLFRTSLWPHQEDLLFTGTGLPVTSLARTVIDFYRYKRQLPASAGPQALSLALDSGRCTLADIDGCAARYRLRLGWRAS